MKIKLDKNEKQVELIKAAGSRNRSTSEAAMEILASLVSPLIQTVIDRGATSNSIYTTLTYNQDAAPSIPLDLYIDKKVDYVRVWSQSIAGGLPTNHIQGLQELKFSTYQLDSAVSMLKKYARVAGLENLARALNRIAQELLVKTEINAYTPVLAALAGASTNGLSHVIDSASTVFQLDDLNRLLTRTRKINAATIDGGTPAGANKGLTDLFVSPEVMEDIRGFVYNPLNTRSGKVDGTGGSTAVPLTDSMRDAIYQNAGAAELFGVAIHELNELSPEGPYGVIFDNFYGGTFTAGTDELVLGVDMSREACLKPVEVDENGGAITTLPDDQYTARAETIGFYSRTENGNIIIDDRALTGIIVQN